MCPRCQERDKAPGQGYCAECRRGKPMGMPIIRTKAEAQAAVERLVPHLPQPSLRYRRLPENDPGPVRRRMLAPEAQEHPAFCQCIPCRARRGAVGVEVLPKCPKHKLLLPCRRCQP